MTDAPHKQAAFINAIREEGTKDEACDFLQQTWNELCEARKQLAATPSAPVVTREQIAQIIASNRAVDYDTLFPSDWELADDILAALQPSETPAQARDAALAYAAGKARQFASHYPEASDGRNTFIILAEHFESIVEQEGQI